MMWAILETKKGVQAELVGQENILGLGHSGYGHFVEKEDFNRNGTKEKLDQLGQVKGVTPGQKEESWTLSEGHVSRFNSEEGSGHCTPEKIVSWCGWGAQ